MKISIPASSVVCGRKTCIMKDMVMDNALIIQEQSMEGLHQRQRPHRHPSSDLKSKDFRCRLAHWAVHRLVYGQRRSICLYDSPLHGMVFGSRPFGNHWFLANFQGLDPHQRGQNNRSLSRSQKANYGWRPPSQERHFLLLAHPQCHLQEHRVAGLTESWWSYRHHFFGSGHNALLDCPTRLKHVLVIPGKANRSVMVYVVLYDFNWSFAIFASIYQIP